MVETVGAAGVTLHPARMFSPVAHAARAMIHGAMYRRNGDCLVSVAQEELIRTDS